MKATNAAIERPNSKICENGADLTDVDVGSVVKVKGTVGDWRGTRQILLERIGVVKDTNEEVQCWEQNTKFLADILSKPWYVSPREQKRLLKEAEGVKEKDRGSDEKRRQRQRLKEKREERHRQQILESWEREEAERGKKADEYRKDVMATVGTSTKKAMLKKVSSADGSSSKKARSSLALD